MMMVQVVCDFGLLLLFFSLCQLVFKCLWSRNDDILFTIGVINGSIKEVEMEQIKQNKSVI